MDTLGAGRMPYDALLPRVQRFAFREFSQNPDLEFSEFQKRLAFHFFGSNSATESTQDLLELQRIYNFESEWYWPSPLLDPEFFRQRAARLNWSEEKRAEYARNLAALKRIALRYQGSRNTTELEMARLARDVQEKWGDRSP
jgi:hypothetical protein